MPHFIVKAEPDVDWYVDWSTIVDAPVSYGTRADFLEDDPDWAPRFDRADEQGSSAMMGPGWFGWDDEEFMVAEPLGEQRILPRKYLRAYTEAIVAEDIPAAFAMTDELERD